jgi:hypothetical protein
VISGLGDLRSGRFQIGVQRLRMSGPDQWVVVSVVLVVVEVAAGGVVVESVVTVSSLIVSLVEPRRA